MSRNTADAETESPRLFWVAAYLIERAFGGHEEGGWWTEIGTLLTDPGIYAQLGGGAAAFSNEQQADDYAERLRAALPALNEGHRPLDSVLSTGLHEVLVIEAETLPPTWPTSTPAYA